VALKIHAGIAHEAFDRTAAGSGHKQNPLLFPGMGRLQALNALNTPTIAEIHNIDTGKIVPAKGINHSKAIYHRFLISPLGVYCISVDQFLYFLLPLFHFFHLFFVTTQEQCLELADMFFFFFCDSE
jgi:hypothetical protein